MDAPGAENVKHLLDLTTLGNKDHTPVVRFLNALNITDIATISNYPIGNDYYSFFIEVGCNGKTKVLFRWLEDKEAYLICQQINDWIKTFVTAAPVNLQQPLL